LVGSTYGRFCIKFPQTKCQVSETDPADWAYSLLLSFIIIYNLQTFVDFAVHFYEDIFGRGLFLRHVYLTLV
jgi:hypothetical protein